MLRQAASSTSHSEEAPPAVLGRLAGLGLACAVTLALLLGGVWLARERLRLPGPLQGDVDTELLPRLERWVHRQPPETAGGVVFGDSRNDCEQGVTVGTALEERLRARGRPVAMVDAAHPMFRPLQYHYLLGDVLAGRPEIAVIGVNPAFVWPNPPPVLRGARFHNLSRRLTPRRAWRIRTALAADDLTLLDPFVYRLEASLDLLFVVDGIEDAWQQASEHWGRRLNGALGLPHAEPPRQFKYRADKVKDAAARRVRGGDVATHPNTVVLRELYRELRDAGVRVVLYVLPTQYRKDREREDAILDAVRAAAGAAPAEWLDLRDVVAAGDFRDYGDHMVPAGCERVAAALDAALGER